MGVISGTLDLLRRSYAGAHIRDGVLYFDPRLPPQLDGLSFAMQFRGTPLRVTLAGGTTDAGRPPRGGAAADQRRGRRRGPRAARRGAVHIRAPAGPACRSPAGPRLTGGRMPAFQGAIFDVDGVLVDSPHQKAWRESLRELMEGEWSDIRGRTTWSAGAFTPQVYQQEVSGKPRLSGARAALEYFHVPDEQGRASPSTPSASRRWWSGSSRPATSPPTPTRCGSLSPSRTPASGSRPRHRRRTRSCSSARSGSTRSPGSRGSRRRRCGRA